MSQKSSGLQAHADNPHALHDHLRQDGGELGASKKMSSKHSRKLVAVPLFPFYPKQCSSLVPAGALSMACFSLLRRFGRMSHCMLRAPDFR